MKRNILKKHLSIFKKSPESGFTLIEVMIALSLLIFILLVTPPIWESFDYQNQTERFSVYQLFHFVSDEIHINQAVEVASNQLIITTRSDDQIYISQYGGNIRRQVNRTGHEVLLRDVDVFEVEQIKNYILITITMESGNQYEKIITKYN